MHCEGARPVLSVVIVIVNVNVIIIVVVSVSIVWGFCLFFCLHLHSGHDHNSVLAEATDQDLEHPVEGKTTMQSKENRSRSGVCTEKLQGGPQLPSAVYPRGCMLVGTHRTDCSSQ